MKFEIIMFLKIISIMIKLIVQNIILIRYNNSNSF